MTNTPSLARTWTEFVVARPVFKCGHLLLQQFSAGDVTRLCDCGCNSYDFKLRSGAGVLSLVPPSENGGCASELEFQTKEWGNTVGFSVFVDSDGNLSGLDVHCCANTSQMPDHPRILVPPFHVYGLLAHEAQSCGQPDLAHKGPQDRLT